MATVYLAADRKHRRDVALKVLLPGLAAFLGAERFLREIQTAARLTHPHILALHDSGEAGGFLYYVMPYVEGASLRQRLQDARRLSGEHALAIAAPVADALSYAHRMGVLHRDIKPENILFSQGHPIVADFGIAKAISTAGGPRPGDPARPAHANPRGADRRALRCGVPSAAALQRGRSPGDREAGQRARGDHPDRGWRNDPGRRRGAGRRGGDRVPRRTRGRRIARAGPGPGARGRAAAEPLGRRADHAAVRARGRG